MAIQQENTQAGFTAAPQCLKRQKWKQTNVRWGGAVKTQRHSETYRKKDRRREDDENSSSPFDVGLSGALCV